MDPELTPPVRLALLALARRTLEAHVRGARLPELPAEVPHGVRRGAFVTLEARGELRGCVGRATSDRPVAEMVRAMTVAAAGEDPRFPPVALKELHDIVLEISVLSEPTVIPLGERDRIDVGRVGLIVCRGALSGLLLPQVAVERRWSAEQFLAATARKAGLTPHAWREPDTDVFAFTADVFGEGERRE